MFVSAFFNKYEQSKLIKEDCTCTCFKLSDKEVFKIITGDNNYQLIYETEYKGIYYQAVYLLPLFNISFSDITFFLERVRKYE